MVIGTTYKHPSMEVTDFINSCRPSLSEKLLHENKQTFSLDNFNFNLLKCANFLDKIFFSTLLSSTLTLQYCKPPKDNLS